jgi:hypothetical protein
MLAFAIYDFWVNAIEDHINEWFLQPMMDAYIDYEVSRVLG